MTHPLLTKPGYIYFADKAGSPTEHSRLPRRLPASCSSFGSSVGTAVAHTVIPFAFKDQVLPACLNSVGLPHPRSKPRALLLACCHREGRAVY